MCACMYLPAAPTLNGGSSGGGETGKGYHETDRGKDIVIIIKTHSGMNGVQLPVCQCTTAHEYSDL